MSGTATELALAMDGQQVTDDLVHEYQQRAPADWPAISNQKDYQSLPTEIKNKFFAMQRLPALPHLPQQFKAYYEHHQASYHKANQAIRRMQRLDIIVTPPPIKKHTLAEKKHLVKNWQACIDVYREWTAAHPDLGAEISDQQLEDQMSQETDFWHGQIMSQAAALGQPHTEKLGYQSDDRPAHDRDRE